MLVYPSGVDVSSSALRFLTARLREHRHVLGTRWRRLSAGRQALLTLVYLRNGQPYAQLAAGFGIGTTTVYRYVTEAVGLLAVLAPTLAEAMRAASMKAYLILDGTLLPIDRIAADRPFYSGKHKKHGMNVQVIADPKGRLLWASPALAGAVHDIRAAREHGIIDALAEAGITCWADKGYQGAGGTVRLPYRGRWDRLSVGQQTVNRSHAKVRALVEQAIATLKSWRILRRLRCSTTRITSLVQAVLTLHLASSS
ncbi:transposase [Streptomyces agglomeratus]|uniref:IS5 family transposase n=1 Tax=Streptomyces agglomeratus TaxID=285458 RepID=UPI0008544C7F|nr:IS5 family transposase [Streptomyces agglomeratus]OEJ21154.1 transposase [Streptomyces agglomeratus]